MKVSHTDGTAISDSYSSASDCYTKPLTFLASSSGKISITVASYSNYSWEKGTGTYAIKYTSRPEYDVLSVGEKKDDIIISDGQTNKYIINATANTRYFIYLEDKDVGSAMSTKTADMGLQILKSDETFICEKYEDAGNCYTKPYTFVTTSADTIKIIAASYYNYTWEKGSGTYSIRYTTRPEYEELTAGELVNDSIITNGQINKYVINVIKGNTYKITLIDCDAGNAVTDKTADIGLMIFYNIESNVDNPVICEKYENADNCYAKPYTFTAHSDGTVVIAAASYENYNWERGTGSYAIKYTVAE